jgi:glutathione peroxidase
MIWPKFIRDLCYPILKKMIKQDVISNNQNVQPTQSIYSISVKEINGTISTLEKFKGKKILIVNTASECGYTSQYAQMEEVYQHKMDELVIIAFPSNDFGAQEPGSDEMIGQFCEKNYHITFPLYAKIEVKGENMHPLYKWLSDSALNGWNDQRPSWNFSKYLVDEKGVLQHYFNVGVEPNHPLILGKDE